MSLTSDQHCFAIDFHGREQVDQTADGLIKLASNEQRHKGDDRLNENLVN